MIFATTNHVHHQLAHLFMAKMWMRLFKSCHDLRWSQIGAFWFAVHIQNYSPVVLLARGLRGRSIISLASAMACSRSDSSM